MGLTVGGKAGQNFKACLQGGRVTLAIGLTLAGGQQTAQVYKQNFHR